MPKMIQTLQDFGKKRFLFCAFLLFVQQPQAGEVAIQSSVVDLACRSLAHACEIVVKPALVTIGVAAVIKALIGLHAFVQQKATMRLDAAVIENNLRDFHTIMKSRIYRNFAQKSIDHPHNNLLHIACDKQYIEMAEALVAQGISPHIQDHHGTTPLHYASYHDNSINSSNPAQAWCRAFY